MRELNMFLDDSEIEIQKFLRLKIYKYDIQIAMLIRDGAKETNIMVKYYRRKKVRVYDILSHFQYN